MVSQLIDLARCVWFKMVTHGLEKKCFIYIAGWAVPCTVNLCLISIKKNIKSILNIHNCSLKTGIWLYGLNVFLKDFFTFHGLEYLSWKFITLNAICITWSQKKWDKPYSQISDKYFRNEKLNSRKHLCIFPPEILISSIRFLL